jgi:hypothetical protein
MRWGRYSSDNNAERIERMRDFAGQRGCDAIVLTHISRGYRASCIIYR